MRPRFGGAFFELSYTRPILLAGDMRRKPTLLELEFTMLLFAGLAPLGYYTWRFVMELI